MKMNHDIRQRIGKARSLSEMEDAVAEIKSRLLKYHEGDEPWENPEELKEFVLRFPPWICQPYQRPPPEEHLKKMEEIKARDKKLLEEHRAEEERMRKELEEKDDAQEDKEQSESNGMSKRKAKKMERAAERPGKVKRPRKECQICVSCINPASGKCGFLLCKSCCRKKCYEEEHDCEGHRIQVKSKREAFRAHQAERDRIAALEKKQKVDDAEDKGGSDGEAGRVSS